MDTFTIILIVLIVLLIVLIFIKLYNTPSLPKCSQKSTIPPGTTYQQNNKLPVGWDLTGTENKLPITPRQTGGVSM